MMVAIGRRMDKKVRALITDMNQPLGFAIGNALEIMEASQTLQNAGPDDLTKLSLELAAHMIHLGKKAATLDEARRTQVSLRFVRTPQTKSAFLNSAINFGRSAGSFCKSPSNVAISGVSVFKIPVQSAALCPAFFKCRNPRIRGFDFLSSWICCQVESRLASSTKTNS